ncbi:uncharacterized protein [Argopecten irradians]|uniref:uncharacterized protein n=1 Tax=Argopecten irradians TaxID=31199 RepID=UPI003714D9DF
MYDEHNDEGRTPRNDTGSSAYQAGTSNDVKARHIILMYLYWVVEHTILEQLQCAEVQNHFVLEQEMNFMNSLLMSYTEVSRINDAVFLYPNRWAQSFNVHNDIFSAARTRLCIFQEYIRLMVKNGVPFHTIVVNLENLLDVTRPTVLPGTRHIRLGSTVREPQLD